MGKDGDKLEQGFERIIFNYRYPLVFILAGLIFFGIGIIYFKNSQLISSPKIEVLGGDAEVQKSESQIVVAITGAVEKPGIYTLPAGSRVEDVLIASGGISVNADREWIDKYINRAAKLIDGQKIYIPSFGSSQDNQSDVSSAKNDGGVKLDQGSLDASTEGMININSASQKLLEDLPGIGPVYAQSIIEHRPYSSVEELLSKDALKKNVYEKVKDKVTVY